MIIIEVIIQCKELGLYLVLNPIVFHCFALNYISWIRFLCHTRQIYVLLKQY